MHLFNNDTNNERCKYAHDSASCVGESHQNSSEIRSDVDVIAIAATTKLSAVKNLFVRIDHVSYVNTKLIITTCRRHLHSVFSVQMKSNAIM